MPRFYASYVARSGKYRKAKLDSISQVRLAEEIETTREAYVIEIIKIGESKHLRARIRISGRMLLAALDSLELMLVSGVRINSAVRTLAECAPPGTARRLWTDLAALIEETGSFGEASRHFPRVFNESMVGIIAAHEAAGCLFQGIATMRNYVAQLQEIKRESTLGAAYPLVVGLVGAAAAAILCVFTLPRFSKMLADIGVKKTNRVTEFFFGLSDVVVRHPAYIIVAFSIPVLAVITCSRPRFRPIFDRLILRIPLLRSSIEALAMARICVTFKALTASGIRVIEALESSAVAAGNTEYANGIYRVVAAVKENLSVGVGFERANIFAPEVVMAVKSGESSLPGVFGRLADYYTLEAKHRVALALQLIQPIMLIFILIWVFGVALAVILPVVEIIDGIR